MGHWKHVRVQNTRLNMLKVKTRVPWQEMLETMTRDRKTVIENHDHFKANDNGLPKMHFGSSK
jgi:hypothetical protein